MRHIKPSTVKRGQFVILASGVKVYVESAGRIKGTKIPRYFGRDDDGREYSFSDEQIRAVCPT